MKLPHNRGGLRTYLLLIGLLAGRATPIAIASGTVFLLVGIALHLWAKGCLHQNREVTVSGPYALVRHPFYLANIFLDFGITAMSGWWLLQVVLPLWWLVVYVPVMHREEAALTKMFGNAYQEYRRRIPMLIPYRRPLRVLAQGFSLQNRNLMVTEIPRAFRFLSYPWLFIMSCQLAASRGDSIFASMISLGALILPLSVALWASGAAWRLHFKSHRRILPAWVTTGSTRLALMAGIVLVGFIVTSAEVEDVLIVMPLGIMLLASSVLVRSWSHSEPVLGEALLAVGLAFLFELLWLGILIIPLYATVILDRRLLASPPERHTFNLSSFRSLTAAHGVNSMMVAGVTLAIVKELWLG